MQRKLGLMAAVVVAAGCGGTSEYRSDASPAPPATTMAGSGYASPATGITGATSGEFAAEVVAVDNTAKTVTLRESAVGGSAAEGGAATTGSTAAGGTTTVRVEGTAGDSLGDLETGDRVVVSCTMGGGPVGTTGTTTTGGVTASPAATMGTGTTMSGAGVLSGCTSVTAIRKAS
jgi:hypothetical protein